MSFTCGFSSGFSAGFAICPPDEAPPVDTTSSSTATVLVAAPKQPRRKFTRDLAGFGIIPVIGVGGVTGDALLSGDLDVPVTSTGSLSAEASLSSSLDLVLTVTGSLARERYGLLAGSIPQAIEGRIRVESALAATEFVATSCYGSIVSDGVSGGAGRVASRFMSYLSREHGVSGSLTVRASVAATPVTEENDEQIVLALLGLPSDFVL